MDIIALKNVPLIKKDTNIPKLIYKLCKEQIEIKEGDIFVVAQTIISKSEGNIKKLNEIKVTEKAKKLAKKTQKDPKLCQVILDESKNIIRSKKNIIISETHHGFICANSGVDRSNIEKGYVTTLPKDPDSSAKKIRKELVKLFNKNIAVIISDSMGRAFRKGCIGQAIGSSNINLLINLEGKKDLYQNKIKTTKIALCDQICAAANLIMGEANEKTPIAIVKGLNYPKKDVSISKIFYKNQNDLFR